MRNRRADLIWAPLLVLSAGLSLSQVLLFDGGGWLSLPMVVLAYPVGRRMASLPLALWVFTAVASAGLVLAFWRTSDPLADWLSVVSVEFALSVLPWWAGRYRRLRAEQRERERGIVAEQARLRERARIARDMHDSLGHELALIALHGGALELAADLADEQRRTAGELRACAVRATHRLHEIVQVLGSADAAADRQPADESIDDLVRRATAAGLRVRLRHDGPVPGWSPMVSQAAHRVVQESLTNAARHAPGASVTVTLARQDDGTRVEVANDPAERPGGGAGSGQGLIGLDERVRLAGGRLVAGARPDGGWAVTAVLPDGGLAGTPPRRSEAGPPAFELGVSRRQTRRRLLQTAALPLGGGLALLAVLPVMQALTVARTGLADERYETLRPGQPRSDVEWLLPPHDIGRAPEVIDMPPLPAGASCVYYQVGDDLLDVGSDVYQLCFVDDVLVSKDRLERA
ncbi:signal transduction histidine kinase [Saccharothrix tamanrassetensis]|uniref:histidine kinase n=1 Tax=Saccharothrix tamanrassetensis TaxID=1051531 RepID=A0A841CJI9_9PSEU|nr:histidine kinase [Saccharothrix tamanrassetensis]MBB5957230.1 signal transduction histidine kinase [Saccharothrix tamanrassetensis]